MLTYKEEYKKYLNILKENPKKNNSLSLFIQKDYTKEISSLVNSLKNNEDAFNDLDKNVISMEQKSRILSENVSVINDTLNILYNELLPKITEYDQSYNDYIEGKKVYKELNNDASVIEKLDAITSRNLNRKKKVIELTNEIDEILNKIKNKENDIKTFDFNKAAISNAANDSDTVSSIENSNTVIWNTLGENYRVANTKISIEEYQKLVKQNGVYQDSNSSIYGDSCLAFAYIHASNLASGNTTDRAKDSLSYVHAGEFKDFRSTNKDEVLSKIYDEVNEGNPVVLQVNGNSKGTVRHFVTVVGYKDSVKNKKDIKESDLLILDSWDGNVERMDTNVSRFMTTGEQTHNNYSGYWLRVLK